MRSFAILGLVSAAIFDSSSALVDARKRTTVTVDASAYDTRTNSNGCSPNGCKPELTRDSSWANNSRWSCNENLEDDNCRICYHFEEPQDIRKMKLVFFKGDERQRSLKVTLNGKKKKTITSGGMTSGAETFWLGSDETEKLCLESVGLDGDEWISIKEAKFLVK